MIWRRIHKDRLDKLDFIQPDGVGAVPRPDAGRPGERRVQAVGAQRAPRPPQPPRRRGPVRAAHGLIDWAGEREKRRAINVFFPLS